MSPQLQALRSFVCNVSSLLPSGPLCFCVFVISSLLLQARCVSACSSCFVRRWTDVLDVPSAAGPSHHRSFVTFRPCYLRSVVFMCVRHVLSLLLEARCVSVCSPRFVLATGGPLCFCVFVTSSLLLQARCVSACSQSLVRRWTWVPVASSAAAPRVARCSRCRWGWSGCRPGCSRRPPRHVSANGRTRSARTWGLQPGNWFKQEFIQDKIQIQWMVVGPPTSSLPIGGELICIIIAGKNYNRYMADE